jgi:hypothetical protein
MAYTIQLDDDFVGGEELELLKTKQAILEKLRVRFGEIANAHALRTTQNSTAKGLSHPRTKRVR